MAAPPIITQVFRDYVAAPRWVEWYTNSDGKKVPRIPGTRLTADTTDPATWRTLDQCRGDRRGIVFNGDGLGGIDLDACRDPVTGTLTDWATDWVVAFNSYTEVSPSGTGVKIFTLGAPAELERNSRVMPGEPIDGKVPKVEAYVTQRHFAVTGERLPETPDEIRATPDAWVLLVKFLADASGSARAGRDDSGSGFGFRFMRDFLGTFEDACAAIRADHGEAGDWARRSDDRQLKRAWERSRPTQDGGGDQRVVIKLLGGGDNLHTAATAAEAALCATNKVYRQSTRLVYFSHEEADATRGRTTSVARISPYALPSLHRELLEVARCVKFDAKGRVMRTGVPDRLLDMVLVTASPKFSDLAGVIETPTMRPDGSLLTEPGYDPITGLMLVNPPTMPPISDRPTRHDAEAALRLLDDELLFEFPFEDDASHSVGLSALMTPVVRAAMDFAPLHEASAPTAGIGKSYLFETASHIATGKTLPALGAGSLNQDGRINKEELDKRLVGAVLSGQPFIFIDNIAGVLGSDFLCQMLTQKQVEVRLLGRTGNLHVKPVATIFATGNNMEIEGDLTRRTIRCSLTQQMERPEERRFKIPKPHQKVLADRGKYIAAALTVVRAHLVAGAPGLTQFEPLVGFDDWSRLVRGALVWLGRADPVATQTSLNIEDPKVGPLDQVLEAWAEGLADGKIVDTWLTAKELAARNVTDFENALREATHTRDLELLTSTKVGKFLKQHLGRIRKGLKIVSNYDAKAHAHRWRLVRTDPAEQPPHDSSETVVPLRRPSSGRRATKKSAGQS
jgi:putative DNA primase/helicase